MVPSLPADDLADALCAARRAYLAVRRACWDAPDSLLWEGTAATRATEATMRLLRARGWSKPAPSMIHLYPAYRVGLRAVLTRGTAAVAVYREGIRWGLHPLARPVYSSNVIGNEHLVADWTEETAAALLHDDLMPDSHRRGHGAVLIVSSVDNAVLGWVGWCPAGHSLYLLPAGRVTDHNALLRGVVAAIVRPGDPDPRDWRPEQFRAICRTCEAAA